MRDQREDIIGVTLALDAAGMVPNKSGNVSCRVAEGFAITPAGVPYRELQPEDIVALPLDGPQPVLKGSPSSEWRMHAAIYRARPELLRSCIRTARVRRRSRVQAAAFLRSIT